MTLQPRIVAVFRGEPGILEEGRHLALTATGVNCQK